jgi:hypothetical protein
MLTGEINRIVSEIKMIQKIDSDADFNANLRVVHSRIFGAFDKFKSTVEQIMNAQDNYALKADCLSSTEALKTFSHTACRLPGFEKLRETARVFVSEDASRRIEGLIEETSGWESSKLEWCNHPAAVVLSVPVMMTELGGRPFSATLKASWM